MSIVVLIWKVWCIKKINLKINLIWPQLIISVIVVRKYQVMFFDPRNHELVYLLPTRHIEKSTLSSFYCANNYWDFWFWKDVALTNQIWWVFQPSQNPNPIAYACFQNFPNQWPTHLCYFIELLQEEGVKTNEHPSKISRTF